MEAMAMDMAMERGQLMPKQLLLLSLDMDMVRMVVMAADMAMGMDTMVMERGLLSLDMAMVDMDMVMVAMEVIEDMAMDMAMGMDTMVRKRYKQNFIQNVIPRVQSDIIHEVDLDKSSYDFTFHT